MKQKDLDTINHIIFFSAEEINNGYHYCNDIINAVKNRFPGHHFIGLPETIAIKDMNKETIEEIIEELQNYLEQEKKEEETDKERTEEE
jgi:hypothetical protein